MEFLDNFKPIDPIGRLKALGSALLERTVFGIDFEVEQSTGASAMLDRALEE